MTLALTVPSGIADLGQVRLATKNRPPLGAAIVDGEGDIFDHVVTSLADLPDASGGFIDLTEGSWFFSQDVNLGSNILRTTTGYVYIRGTQTQLISGTGAAALKVEGGVTLVEQLKLQGTNAINISGGELILVQCAIIATGNYGIFIIGNSIVSVWGGSFNISAGITHSAIRLHSTGMDELTVTGTTVSAPNFVSNLGPTADFIGLRVNNVTGTNGINWAPAPNRGLSAVSNQLNCASPILGFTVLTPGYNLKANLDSAGLMSETPIVP